MEFPELSKYIELEKRGLSAVEICRVARDDELNSIQVIYVLKNVFDLSTAQSKEIWMNLEGNEHHLAFHEELMDILDKIN